MDSLTFSGLDAEQMAVLKRVADLVRSKKIIDDSALLSLGLCNRTIEAFTPAQMRNLRGIIAGKSYAEIAHEHGLKEATIRDGMQVLYTKYGFRSPAHATAYAIAKGIIPPTEALELAEETLYT